jgi:hypothetical protein
VCVCVCVCVGGWVWFSGVFPDLVLIFSVSSHFFSIVFFPRILVSAEVDFVDWSDAEAIAMMVTFGVFTLVTIVVTIIVIVKNKTPVIFYAR